MSSQPPPRPDPASVDQRAWRAFLGAHAALTRRLDADLAARHGLTLSDYDVLLQLAWAGGRLRPSELADRVLLTRAGVTRLLAGLEEAGHIRRERCEDDRRVSYAVLTPAGRTQPWLPSKPENRFWPSCRISEVLPCINRGARTTSAP